MKTKPKKSFRSILTTTILVSAMIPLLLLGFFSVLFITSNSKAIVETRIGDALASSKSNINETLELYHQKFEDFSSDEIFLNYIENKDNEDELRREMFSLISNKGKVMSMIYIDLEAKTTVSTGEVPEVYSLPLFENWGIFRQAKEAKNIGIYSNPFRDRSGNLNALSLTKAIYEEDVLKGFLILDLKSEMIQSIIYSIKDSSLGDIQFIITGPTNTIIYNDSVFISSFSGLDNVFVENRFDPSSKDNEEKLDGMIMMTYKDAIHDMTYYGFMSNELLFNQSQSYISFITIFMVISFILVGIIGLYLSRTIFKPILDLADLVKDADSSDIITQLDTDREDEIGEMAKQFKALLERIAEKNNETLIKQDLLRITEIKALQSQINPHFLYNTLDSIKWKAKLNETEDIAFMITELSVILKGSMDTNTIFVSIEEELKFVKSYMNIQSLRYLDRFKFILDIEEGIEHMVIPKLILQPLVENALVHGIEPLDENGIIQLNIWADQDYLYFSVVDTGVGTNENLNELLMKVNTKSIGLHNVQKRIKLYYGNQYGLDIQSKLGEGTNVLIKIPLEIKED